MAMRFVKLLFVVDIFNPLETIYIFDKYSHFTFEKFFDRSYSRVEI